MPDYDSPYCFTNDLADLRATWADGVYVVPLSADAKMRRDPSRQYCGNFITYGDKGGRTYRHNADTHDLIAAGPYQHRDMTSSFPMVKTKAKARARGDRQLLDVQEQDVRITTTATDIPSTRVTLLKAGMRTQVKGTHWGPTCDDWHYARILTAQPKPHGKGELYDVDLEMALGDESEGPEQPPEPDYEGDVFAGLQRTTAYDGGSSHPKFAGTYEPGDEIAGWKVQDTTGPIAILESSAPWLRIQVSSPMRVRIHAAGQGANVYFPAQTRALSVTVNGVVIATDSRSTGTGFQAWTRTVDVRNYHLVAGDIVSVTGTATDEWGNLGLDNTFLRVGRGSWASVGSPSDPWVGP